jgi:hypothetical protein
MSRIQGKFIVSHKETWTTLTTRTFTHNLGTQDVQVTLYNLTTNRMILPDEVELVDDNSLDITVSELPPAGIRVILLGL